MPVLSAKIAAQMASDIYIVQQANLDPATNPALGMVLKSYKQYFALTSFFTRNPPCPDPTPSSRPVAGIAPPSRA